MPKRKRNTSSLQETACVLCHQECAEPNNCGRILGIYWMLAHEFCLIFANILFAETPSGGEALEITHNDLTRKLKKANRKQCFVCGERGAAITCAESGCDRSFHLPCAEGGECITQFFGEHRSFCWEHRPQQEAVTTPAEDTNCAICLKPVGDKTSFSTLVCPACTHTRFHRSCIQLEALNAGTTSFQCPGCRNITLFRKEMSTLGIQIPDRRPAQEENGVNALHLLQRHHCCDAIECFHPEDGDQAEEEGPWQLIPCRSCTAQNMHRWHSCTCTEMDTWVCDICAGLGTSCRATSECAGRRNATQQPDDAKYSLASQAAVGSQHSSQRPKFSNCIRIHVKIRGTRPSCSLEDTTEQCRGRCGSTGRAAPRPESCSHTSTRQSPEMEQRGRPRQRGGSRIRSRARSRSPLRAGHPSSQSPTRTPRGSRPIPAPDAQICTQNSG